MSGDAPFSDAVLARVFAEARAAYPAECCGWIAGDDVRPARNAQADGDHPTEAARGEERAYVIAGDDLLAFVRALDGPTPPTTLYHSHPNGSAYFSNTDRAVAENPWGDGPAYPVTQLVIGVDADGVTEWALFGWQEFAGGFIELARARVRDA